MLRTCNRLQASWRQMSNYMRLAREWEKSGPVSFDRWLEISGNAPAKHKPAPASYEGSNLLRKNLSAL